MSSDAIDMAVHGEIVDAVGAVRARIAASARRAGRDPGEVTLVAVTKGVAPRRIAAALAAGVRHLGENRVHEALAHQEELEELAPELAATARWHMIGHVQRNKAKPVAERFASVDSVDSLRLAEALDRRARAAGRRLPVLLEVNVSGEATKHGFAPEELEEAATTVLALEALSVEGLMAIGPLGAGPERVRAAFEELAALADALRRRHRGRTLARLSMGMSGDFEVAIAAGATEVRVGSLLFGARPREGREGG